MGPERIPFRGFVACFGMGSMENQHGPHGIFPCQLLKKHGYGRPGFNQKTGDVHIPRVGGAGAGWPLGGPYTSIIPGTGVVCLITPEIYQITDDKHVFVKNAALFSRCTLLLSLLSSSPRGPGHYADLGLRVG